MAQILMQWTNSFRKSFRFSLDSGSSSISSSGGKRMNPDPIRGAVVDKFEATESFILEWKHKDSQFDAKKYLSAVDDILDLKNNQELLSNIEYVERVDSVVEIAMKRLGDEFWDTLCRSVLSVDPEQLCGQLLSSIRRISSASATTVADNDERERLSVELLYSNAVLELSEIAQRMIKAGHEKECWENFSKVRYDVLHECLCVLGAETMSIEQVQKLDSGLLQKKMKKWYGGVKMVTRYLLFAEKDLCDDIFKESEQIARICFTEIAKTCMMELLNFAEVIANVKHSPEMLVRIFDMYNTLAKSMVQLKKLFSYDSSGFICSETERVIAGLGKAVIDTFEEFESRVRNDSTVVTPNGEVHRMVRYVMNYLLLLVDSSESFRLLLRDRSEGDHIEGDNACPMDERLRKLVTSMEINITEKSQEYEDQSLRLIFLMNNIRYVVLKVKKHPEFEKLFGENWTRKRISQAREYSELYLRDSWKSVLSSLSFDKKISCSRLKEKFRQFNAAFEEIHKRQSAWVISDPQLRDELRISLTERVIPVYRGFIGQVGRQVDRLRHPSKYMKYETDDIENYLMDLFQGETGDSQNTKWKDRVASGRELLMEAVLRVK